MVRHWYPTNDIYVRYALRVERMIQTSKKGVAWDGIFVQRFPLGGGDPSAGDLIRYPTDKGDPSSLDCFNASGQRKNPVPQSVRVEIVGRRTGNRLVTRGQFRQLIARSVQARRRSPIYLSLQMGPPLEDAP